MYSINKTLLQVLRTREGYQRLAGAIKPGLFDKEIRLLLEEIARYWKANPDIEEIQIEVFAQNFRLKHQSLSEAEWSVYQDILLLMQENPDEAIATELVRALKTMQFSKELDETNTRYSIGEDIDIFESIRDLIDKYENDVRKSASDDWCKADLEEIIMDETKGLTLTPRLKCLQNAMPGLRTGMQIIVAARPGKGKTSFCADLITGIMQQPEFQQEQRPVLWFNNEGKAIRIKGTCIRAALRKDFNDIVSMGADKATKEFERVTGGRDSFRIYDIHGRDYRHLERIIENAHPLIVVWDMLDNVRGFRGAGNNRTDERLEQLYQWSRECSVKYDFLSIPTSQISNDGAGLQWVPDSCLKDSKTGKQGACDAILTIGTESKVGFEHSRFLYLPKTKFTPVKGFPADLRSEVYFDETIAAFKEGQ